MTAPTATLASSNATRVAGEADPRLWIPTAVGICSFLAYGTLTILRYRLRHGSWDTAVFTQAIKGYAALSAPVVDVKSPGMNQLGDHFSPILAVVAPVYRAFPSSLTVNLVQVLLVAMSALLLTRTAIDLLGRTAGALLGSAYALSFGLQSAITVGFHENCFAAPILAIVGDRYLRGRYRSAVLWSLPLLLVKEDFGLVLGGLAICLFVVGKRTLACMLGVGAFAYLAIVVGIVIPAINPRGQYDYLRIAQQGAGSAGPLHTLLTLPVHMVSPDVKLATLMLSFLVVGMVAVRSPFAWLAVPIFVERFASPIERYWGPTWHYSLPVMPIVFIGAIEVIARIRGSERTTARRMVMIVPPVSAGIAVCLLPIFSLHLLATHDYWQRDARAEAFDRLAREVPRGASVQADSLTGSFFVPDHDVYWLSPPDTIIPGLGIVDADFIVVNQEEWSGYGLHGVEYARDQHPGVLYRVVFDQEGYLLLERD